MHIDDYRYLKPEHDTYTTCVHLVDGQECGEPTDGGPLCDDHPARTPAEYDAYARYAAA